jgi:hypothetical protein
LNNFNGEFNKFKKCPHCGLIWFKVVGCDSVQCGKRTGIKDINDILQGKDKVLKSVDDLIDRGWLDKISDDKNILKLLIKEKTKSL